MLLSSSVRPRNGRIAAASTVALLLLAHLVWPSAAVIAQASLPAVIINEVDSDTPGTDAAEFVELYDGGVGNASLDGLVVVFFNGSNDLSYAAFDLDGRRTDASGYFTLGNASVPGVDRVFAGNLLQNGADAVALYEGNATDFPNNTPLRTTGLVDAIVYGTNDPDDAGLLTLLNAGEPQVDEDSGRNSPNVSSQRLPSGAGGARNTSTYAQQAPTPDRVNGCGGVVVARGIPEIQGAGVQSPFIKECVETTGIVTAAKSNGFFIQSSAPDMDPATSEGLFVFIGRTPAVAVGDSIRLRGIIDEFFNLTQVAAAPGEVVVESSGNALPVPVDLVSVLDPAALPGALERLESMRVHADSLVSVGGTNQFGEVFTVPGGVARPFREPGIDITAPLPQGTPCCVPRFDSNPERLMLDTDGAAGATSILVSTGATFADVTGPLDFTFGDYKLVPEAAPAVTPGMTATPVPVPNDGEFTVGSFNLLNLFVSNANFADRLNKASLAIREAMRSPDILGVAEVGDIQALEALAARVNADAIAAGGIDPQYQAYLLEGSDEFPGDDIDVGFLVKASRVTVVSVTQEGKGAQFDDPSEPEDQDALFERPPLVLRAAVQSPHGSMFPVTVIANHLQSLIDVELDSPRGERQRLKRRLQAEFTANLVQRIQGAENVVLVGDFNAFQFNDGYVDVIGTIKGTPTPADQVVLASPDLVAPDLTAAVETSLVPADQKYSYVFGGNAQTLDHVLVDEEMLGRLNRFAFARINSDFPLAFAADPTRPEGSSDHDMPVAFFTFPPPKADVSIVKAAPSASVTVGADLIYTVTARNDGPDHGASVVMTDALPAQATFQSIAAPIGWTCATPAPGTNGSVSCASESLSIGATADFELTARLACSVANGVRIDNVASLTSTAADPADANNASTASVTAVNMAPELSKVWNDRPLLLVPNHKMVPVTVNYEVSDDCGPVTTTLTVTSNEPVDGRGDGHTSPDWQVIDAHHVLLRAERSGGGHGRIYTVTITATDAAGNRSTAKTWVLVPKSNNSTSTR